MDALMLIIVFVVLAFVISGGVVGSDSRDGIQDDHQRSTNQI